MNEPLLTHEAKAAIRKYVFTLFVLPGIVAAALMFALGFFIRDVTYEKAYNNAFKEANHYIRNLSSETYEAAYRTKETLRNTNEDIQKNVIRMKEIQKQIKTIHVESEAIRKKLKTAKSFQESEKITEAVAETIAKRKDFSNLIAININNKLAKTDEVLKTNRNLLASYLVRTNNLIKPLNQRLLSVESYNLDVGYLLAVLVHSTDNKYTFNKSVQKRFEEIYKHPLEKKIAINCKQGLESTSKPRL